MTENRQQNFIIPIIVMFALFFMIAFVTNLAGSMGVIVTNQFGASKALSQLGNLANFIAYACMGIPAGLILKRKGYKVTALTAVIVGFTGVGIQFLSGYAESFAVYVLGAFVAGFSMCMLNIVVNPMLNTLGGGGNRGNQLIQFGGCCNSIGGTLAPVLTGWLVGGAIADATVAKAAPVMIIAMVTFAVAFVVILFTKIPEPHMETAQERADRKAGKIAKDPHSPFSFRHFILGAIAIFCYVGQEVGIPSTANVYYSGLDWVGPAIAGTFVGAYWFSMLIGRLLGGVIGNRISSRRMLSVAASIEAAMLIVAILIPETVKVTVFSFTVPVSLLLMTICGFFASIMWGCIFNLAVEGLGKYTAAASGIFMTLVCGGGILPFFQNLIADHVGSIQSYWLPVVCLLYIAFYALVGSKNVNKDIKVE